MTHNYKPGFVNISDLNKDNTGKVIEKVKNDNMPVYIMENNVPEAVMIPVEVFHEIQDMLFCELPIN